MFPKNRGGNEPEAPGAPFKRLYLENVPHLPGGSRPHMPLWNKISSNELGVSKYPELQGLRLSQLQPSGEILSVADKYNFMRDTFRKRLAFGKLSVDTFVSFCSSVE